VINKNIKERTTHTTAVTRFDIIILSFLFIAGALGKRPGELLERSSPEPPQELSKNTSITVV
jgi:hypothetical protein